MNSFGIFKLFCSYFAGIFGSSIPETWTWRESMRHGIFSLCFGEFVRESVKVVRVLMRKIIKAMHLCCFSRLDGARKR